MRKIEFLSINKRINDEVKLTQHETTMGASIKGDYIGMLLSVKSKLMTIENQCKIELRKYATDTKSEELNVEQYNEGLLKVLNTNQVELRELIKRLQDSRLINYPDKLIVFVKDLIKDLENYTNLLQSKIKRYTHEANRGDPIGITDRRLYELATACGGVYIFMDQSFDPLMGGSIDGNNVKQSDGNCAGLIMRWKDQCVKYGTPRYPIVVKESVLDQQEQYFKLIDKAETKKSIKIADLDVIDFQNLLTISDNRPFYIVLYTGKLSHAIGFRKRSDDSCEFFDPNLGYFFFPTQASFVLWFMSYIRAQRIGKCSGHEFTDIELYQFKDPVLFPDNVFPKKDDFDRASLKYEREEKDKIIRKNLNAELENAIEFIDNPKYSDKEAMHMLSETLNSYLVFCHDIDSLSLLETTFQLIEDARNNPGVFDASVSMKKMKHAYQRIAKLIDSIPDFKKKMEDIKTGIAKKIEEVKAKSDENIEAFSRAKKIKLLEDRIRARINEVTLELIELSKQYPQSDYRIQKHIDLRSNLTHKLKQLGNSLLVRKFINLTDPNVHVSYDMNACIKEANSIFPDLVKILKSIDAKDEGNLAFDQCFIIENQVKIEAMLLALTYLSEYLRTAIQDSAFPVNTADRYYILQKKYLLTKIAHIRDELTAINVSRGSDYINDKIVELLSPGFTRDDIDRLSTAYKSNMLKSVIDVDLLVDISKLQNAIMTDIMPKDEFYSYISISQLLNPNNPDSIHSFVHKEYKQYEENVDEAVAKPIKDKILSQLDEVRILVKRIIDANTTIEYSPQTIIERINAILGCDMVNDNGSFITMDTSQLADMFQTIVVGKASIEYVVDVLTIVKPLATQTSYPWPNSDPFLDLAASMDAMRQEQVKELQRRLANVLRQYENGIKHDDELLAELEIEMPGLIATGLSNANILQWLDLKLHANNEYIKLSKNLQEEADKLNVEIKQIVTQLEAQVSSLRYFNQVNNNDLYKLLIELYESKIASLNSCKDKMHTINGSDDLSAICDVICQIRSYTSAKAAQFTLTKGLQAFLGQPHSDTENKVLEKLKDFYLQRTNILYDEAISFTMTRINEIYKDESVTAKQAHAIKDAYDIKTAKCIYIRNQCYEKLMAATSTEQIEGILKDLLQQFNLIYHVDLMLSDPQGIFLDKKLSLPATIKDAMAKSINESAKGIKEAVELQDKSWNPLRLFSHVFSLSTPMPWKEEGSRIIYKTNRNK